MKDMIDTVICGSVFDKLPEIPTGIANCCVTSPPYWGLRDYGVEGQLGLEKTPEEYVAKMVEVFREVKRVLRDDGTLWLNMGDTYNNAAPGTRDAERWPKQSRNDHKPEKKPAAANLKPKDLCGIPWRVAFALQADGWYLRQDIIWHKPNPMPEGVRDRCTKAHEYIFLMTKKPKYYYDIDAIRVPQAESNDARPRMGQGPNTKYNQKRGSWNETHNDNRRLTIGNKIKDKEDHPAGKNRRDVWTVPLAPYPEAHFATFPSDLILPCILAGCPQWVCKKCGEPRRRIVDAELVPTKKAAKTFVVDARDLAADKNDQGSNRQKDGHKPGWINKTTTTGWTDCGCGAGFDGGIVLDPFMGSGTVGLVAYQNNRHYIGIELNPEYRKLGRIDKERDKYALFEDQQ